MKNPKNDVYFSIILLLFIGFVFQQTYNFPEEAALFPRVFAASLAILTVMLLIKSLKDLKTNTSEEIKKLGDYKRPILIIAGLIIYTLILKLLGYIIATFLLSAYVIYVLGYRDTKKLVLTSGMGVVLTYVVFKMVLGVNLPEVFFMV